jgi:hypothetical protein
MIYEFVYKLIVCEGGSYIEHKPWLNLGLNRRISGNHGADFVSYQALSYGLLTFEPPCGAKSFI